MFDCQATSFLKPAKEIPEAAHNKQTNAKPTNGICSHFRPPRPLGLQVPHFHFKKRLLWSFYGAQGFPPASTFLLTKTQDRLSWNRQRFSVKARPRKSPGTAQIHPSRVETDRTCPAKTLFLPWKRNERNRQAKQRDPDFPSTLTVLRRILHPPKQINNIKPQDSRGTVLMK